MVGCVPEIAALSPAGDRRMSANPHANGGLCCAISRLPDFRDYAVEVAAPGRQRSEATARARRLPPRRGLRQPRRTSASSVPTRQPRIAWTAVFEATDARVAGRAACDGRAAGAGRPGDGGALRDHLPGLARGLPADRAPRPLQRYEAFIHIVDSMFNQHAKWLETSARIPWRMPIASLNYLLTSHVWRQDHNGFSHQDPGFIDHVVNKKAEVIRVYLPPDANTLLSTMDHCLRSRHYVNVIVAGKPPALSTSTWTPQSPLHAPDRHLGVGLHDDGARAGCGHGLLRRRPDAGDARGCRPCCVRCAGLARPRRQCRRSDAARVGRRSILMASPMPSSTRSSRSTAPSSSRTTATPG